MHLTGPEQHTALYCQDYFIPYYCQDQGIFKQSINPLQALDQVGHKACHARQQCKSTVCIILTTQWIESSRLMIQTDRSQLFCCCRAVTSLYSSTVTKFGDDHTADHHDTVRQVNLISKVRKSNQ